MNDSARNTSMQGITIYDAPELIDVLKALGDLAFYSEWVCSGVECFGDRAQELDAASDTKRRVCGSELIEICSGVSQTVEGYFRAFRAAETEPWIILRAIEGEFDVQSDNPIVFSRVHERFKRVVPFPPDEIF